MAAADKDLGPLDRDEKGLSRSLTDSSRGLDSSPQHYYGEDGQDSDTVPEQLQRRFSEASKRSVRRNKDEDVVEQPFTKTVLQMLRPDFILNNLTFDGFKPVFSFWARNFIAVILFIIPKINTYMGNASFLILIICTIMPSDLPVVANFILIPVLMAFICLGLAFGMISDAIGSRIRGDVTAAQSVAQLVAANICSKDAPQAELSQCLRQTVLEGYFLDVRCTVVTIVFYIIGFTIITRLRSVSPLFIPGSILGYITLTIMSIYSNWYPFFAGKTLSESLLIPFGFGLCLCLVCNVIFFPKTASKTYFGALSGMIGTLSKANAVNVDLLKNQRPSQPGFSGYKKFFPLIAGFRGIDSKVEPLVKMIGREISFCRFHTSHVGQVRNTLRDTVGAFSSLIVFYENIEEAVQDSSDSLKRKETGHSSSYELKNPSRFNKLYMLLHEHHKPVGRFEQSKIHYATSEHPSETNMNFEITVPEIDSLLRIIDETCRPMYELCQKAFGIALKWMAAANSFRTLNRLFRNKKCLQEQAEIHGGLVAVRKELADALSGFTEGNNVLLKKFKEMESENRHLMFAISSQGMLFSYATQRYLHSIIVLLDLMISADDLTPEPFFHFPGNNSLGEPSEISPEKLGELENAAEMADMAYSVNEADQQARRNADSDEARTIFHLFGARVIKGYRFIFDRKTFFGAKTATFVMLSAFPSFFPQTVHFFYYQRLVWVPIMVALGTYEMSAETIYGAVSKIVYSFIASMLGAAAWYISTGSGHGNYYGYATVMGVFGLPFAYYRVHCKLLQPAGNIIVCITFILIMGMSWVDGMTSFATHLGYGWHVAWVRCVTVLVGCGIGAFCSLFPYPSTAKKAIRVLYSNTIFGLAQLHTYTTDFAAKRMMNPAVHIDLSRDPCIRVMRENLRQLTAIQQMELAIKYEPPLTGHWPKAKYDKLFKHVVQATLLYRTLYEILGSLDDPANQIEPIMDRNGWKDASIGADLYACLYMASRALVSGCPLPAITPSHLEQKHVLAFESATSSLKTEFRKRTLPEFMAFLEARLEKDDFRKRNVAVVIMRAIYERIDAIILTVKELVGEQHLYNPFYIETFTEKEDDESNETDALMRE